MRGFRGRFLLVKTTGGIEVAVWRASCCCSGGSNSPLTPADGVRQVQEVWVLVTFGLRFGAGHVTSAHTANVRLRGVLGLSPSS